MTVNISKKVGFSLLAVGLILYGGIFPSRAFAFDGLDFNDPTPIGGSGLFSALDYNDPTPIVGTNPYSALDYNDPTPISSPNTYSTLDYNNPTPIGNANALDPNLGYLDITRDTPTGDTHTPEYSYRPGDTYTPEYSYTPGSTYTPEYSYSPASYIPSVAIPYVAPYAAFFPTPAPRIAAAPTFTAAPVQQQRAPTFTSAAPQTQSQSQSQTSTNTNVNPNTNTNLNDPLAYANASNGPITINNTVNAAPVVPVSQYPVQHPVQYTFGAPSCTISSSNYNNYGYNYNGYYNNQPMTLTWSSSNGTSAYISPNVGTVNPNGSTTVYPNGYTTYTMTVYGSGGTATCQTTANYSYVAPTYVAPTYVAPAVYTAPVAPYVALSQIPYTGFDYGPVGNAIYWMSLLAFAVAAGYLLVYGMPKMAFANMFARSEVADTDAVPEEITSDAPAAVASPTQAEPTIVNTFSLPAVENHRLPAPTLRQAGITTDSMILERSGQPRIVIARG